ncbi:uncharacterized protein A1O9_01940 [Exophiala aquamarina CBS 119918]|uniref:Alpha/beta hydrolase fold-3 domain-containing protein n=1 Tax=Exophiala aquamarina CBS 119918 TaxID=1182545 RepID=A0A072PXQ9_9EURO|nr:uncharacterized protein A1O9_01940 [Exophiala aquamarina CBS 119918]KEF60380.1 hypothetical protein A1O9_01940 [Exophiala aquamarina CBS 119918]
MDPSPKAMIRLLLPRLPLILKTALFNALSISENSAKQHLTTEVAVVVLRSIMNMRRPVRFLQRVSTRDPGIKGPIWVSKVTLAPPLDREGPREAVCAAIAELGSGNETYTTPDVAAVEAEWNGYRDGVSSTEPRPDLPEAEQYRKMMKEVTSDVTILYFHGGAYFLMDPATVRDSTLRQARLTRGRCYSVRYRLAPQYPFPAQLLDALMSYLSLLSPPPGVPHSPVPARHIVFAGDSAGANLAAALLLLLLTLRRMGLNTIRYHGVDVPVELPAGVALNSPWVDITRSLPSINKNAHLDYLDPPTATGVSRHEPTPDVVWPTEPPRADMFCNASMLIHPLTSPLAAAAELWKGMPPVFMCLGNEALEDEILILARRMHQGGGVVELVGYEGMPHCFAMIFPRSVSGSDCYQRWGTFCSEVVQGRGTITSQASWVKAFSKPLEPIKTPIEQISNLSDHDVADAMDKMQQHALTREKDALQKWNERHTRARL